MGSRAVIVLCRDEDVSKRRFGIGEDGRGVIYTRTGRRFFNDRILENALLDRLDLAMQRASLWEELQSGWIVLDTELLPWSAKAQEQSGSSTRRRARLRYRRSVRRARGSPRLLRAESKCKGGRSRMSRGMATQHASSMHTVATAGRSTTSKISRWRVPSACWRGADER